MSNFIFDGWMPLARTLTLGLMSYIGLVFLLRVSGKRALSKMNAFDLIVTVALGSTLATVLLSKDVSLVQGFAALALLLLMQFVVTWLSVRFKWVRELVASEPTLLAYDGKVLDAALKKTRVSREEVLAAVRAAGFGHLDEVSAVVLETDGSCNVVKRNHDGKSRSIQGIV